MGVHPAFSPTGPNVGYQPKTLDTSDGTSAGTVIPSVIVEAGEGHLGAVGGDSLIAVASFTRPANTTAYASGQLLSNSTTAGSVASLAFVAARKTGGTGRIARARLTKSGTSITNASFRLHLYRTAPATISNGDGGAWLTSDALAHLGSFDVLMDKAFSDGAKGVGVPSAGSAIVFDTATGSQTIYGLLEARGAYTPASGEVFTVALEVDRD